MNNIHQLAFSFTPLIHRRTPPHVTPPWRAKAIAQRHNLPMAQARFYAAEMGLPNGEACL